MNIIKTLVGGGLIPSLPDGGGQTLGWPDGGILRGSQGWSQMGREWSQTGAGTRWEAGVGPDGSRV